MTLVELIVTFALIGLFMTASSFVLTSSLRLFTHMQSVSSAVTVSDVLLDKIAGEIAAAKEPNMNQDEVAFDYGGYYVWLGKDDESEWITMWNRSGSPLAIYAEPDGALCLKYYETVRGEVGTEFKADSVKVPEMDWHFDPGVYMGYHITEGGLTFTREDPDDHPNVIRIDLEITNDRTGFTYQAFRYAECYNYKFKQEQVKKYLGVRPEGSGLSEDEPPEAAVDFVIKKEESEGGGGEPEKEKCTYNVYYRTDKGSDPEGWIKWIDGEGFEGEKVKVSESSEPEDRVIKIAPPDIRYYAYDASNSQSEITLTSVTDKNNLYLRYEPNDADPVKFKVICRAKKTDGSDVILREQTYEETIESQFTLIPEEVLEYDKVQYKCSTAKLDFKVDRKTKEVYYFEYELIPVNDSLILEDSAGGKHELFVTIDWEEMKTEAIKNWGAGTGNDAKLLHDETGFYIAINDARIDHNNISSDTTLQEWQSNQIEKVIKVSPDSKLFTSNDVETGKWKKGVVLPHRGDLAYFGGEFYIAGNSMNNQDSIPPWGGYWIKIPQKR